MQFKIFTVPAGDDAAMEELNRFLRGNKVLEVEQQLVANKTGCQWHFCVKYLANAGQQEGKVQSKVDYKEVLDEKTFAVFSQLREARKKVAEEDGLPVYAVFTNDELAGIAALDEISVSALKAVKGIGDKKAERFGKRLVDLYKHNNEQTMQEEAAF
jgi:superfamily II DNA helicase RecQ